MKTIKKIGIVILVILIMIVSIAAIIGVCWLLGTIAHTVGFLPHVLNAISFWWVVIDGLAVLCPIGLLLWFVLFAVAIAEDYDIFKN